MLQEARTGIVLGAALLMLTAGCVGQVTDTDGTDASQQAGPNNAPDQATGANVDDGAKADDGTRTFSLIASLDKTSGNRISIVSVDVTPKPAVTEALIENPGRIEPGGQRHVLVVRVDAGNTVPSLTVHLELEDGRGTSKMALTVGPWAGTSDVEQVLTLHHPEAGAVTSLDLDGPLDGRVLTNPAVRSYGLLVWPDDRVRVLETFPFQVHVPPGFPNDLQEGAQLRFLIADPSAPVTWSKGDRTVGSDPVFETNATPGLQRLSVSVGDGAEELPLPYTVDALDRYNGTIAAAAQPIADEDLRVNGAEHGFRVRSGSTFVSVVVEVTGDGPRPRHADVNASILDDQGNEVATSQATGPYEDRIQVPEGLPAGNYTLYVSGNEGVTIDYTATVEVFY